MSRRAKRVVSAIAVSALTATLLGVVAAPAQAATERNGVCEVGEFCLYYNSNQQGSVSDHSHSISNYGASQPSCYEFKGPGAGKGQCIKNNAASAWNRRSAPVTVFYKSNYSGAIDNFGPGAKANLRPYLKNDNAGHRLGSSANGTLEVGLYKTSAARITSYFDGYENNPGRHEGIDIKRYVGASVYALISGKVTNRYEGYRGKNGLSTLAIYNSSLNKTIIYLHTNPNNFSVGTSISKGQKIGVEDWRGISYSSWSHTHAEMRPGYQTHASFSSDSTLDNPIPTSFWMARGYNICCQYS